MKNAAQVFSSSNCSRKRRRIVAPRSQADENIYVEIDATSDPYRSFCLPISEPSPLSSEGDKKMRDLPEQTRAYGCRYVRTPWIRRGGEQPREGGAVVGTAACWLWNRRDHVSE